jgi:hypothetical protein
MYIKKDIKKIEIKPEDDNGLVEEILEWTHESFDSGLTNLQKDEVRQEIINKNGFIYEFYFWARMFDRIGCKQYDNTIIMVHNFDSDSRMFIDSNLEGLFFVIIMKGIKIESNIYLFNDVFVIMNHFKVYQEIYFKLLELKY